MEVVFLQLINVINLLIVSSMIGSKNIIEIDIVQLIVVVIIIVLLRCGLCEIINDFVSFILESISELIVNIQKKNDFFFNVCEILGIIRIIKLNLIFSVVFKKLSNFLIFMIKIFFLYVFFFMLLF